MATKRKTSTTDTDQTENEIEDISRQLIIDLNKEFGTRIAFNLSDSTAPTIVKRWISTSSKQLDYAISNKKDGGLPEGRIIELSGLPSTGKSHIAYEVCKNVQRLGGLVVYIDSENATSIDKLREMGIDVSRRFVFCDTHCTEEAFKIIESTIIKARAMMDKNIPMLVVWDSIAGSSPKEELDGDYDKNTVGLQARILSKGMRKITGVIGQSSATLLCLNQLRSKIGGYGGDPYVTPGGAAVPYFSSVRIRLTGEGTRLKDSAGNVVGIKVPLRVIKNKVAPPHRTLDLEIRFGVGISEEESLLTELLTWCSKHEPVTDTNGNLVKIEGAGKSWKTLLVTDNTGKQLIEKKFTKNDFNNLMNNPEYKNYIDVVIESALVVKFGDPEPENDDYNPKSDLEPLEEILDT